MNDLYHWHAEVMVNLEMAELRKEMDSIRLLHDAELSNPGLFERATTVFGSALVKLGQHLQRKYARSHQVCHTTSDKYAV